MVAIGAPYAIRETGWRRAVPAVSLVVAALVVYMANFQMAADRIFLEPASVTMRTAAGNTVDSSRLVVGIEVNGDARAYPIQFIGYHHQVRDSAGGLPVMVSYCTVCRTGRVFSPVVNGRAESFRLVGMDHFNAMFEDKAPHSWWRQATGEAIVGPRKGTVLPEIPSRQTTLAEWVALHPRTLIMQPDSVLRDRYSTSDAYETGASRKKLTGTDTVSWRDKAWVVGLTVNGESKAYDWNRLRRETVVHDRVGGTPVVIVLARDRRSFFAFERPSDDTRFELRGDSLVAPRMAYALDGHGASGSLKSVFASQEFWHSWRTFHPGTGTY
jgi:hypothetical protein